MMKSTMDAGSGSEYEDDDDPDSVQVPGGGRNLETLASFKSQAPSSTPAFNLPGASKVRNLFTQGPTHQVGYTLTTPSAEEGIRPPQFPMAMYQTSVGSFPPRVPGIGQDGVQFRAMPQGFSRITIDPAAMGGLPGAPPIPFPGGGGGQMGLNFFPVETTTDDNDDEGMGVAQTYADYMPSKLTIGLKHPDPVVESTSLSSVEPVDVWYSLSIPYYTISSGQLSALQLEAITYACQQHENILPDGSRAGFLIGDGAGVGKGRTIAGIIFENYLKGRKKAVWVSVLHDLKYDAERDLNDIGADNIKVYSLSKFRYGKINSAENGKIKKGVLFSTYSALIAKSSSNDGSFKTRLDQILDWCGPDFDGCLVFDECHRAKNLCPSSSGKPTQTGLTVLNLQSKLPKARVVYASATGATEPRDMAYMTRLGIWGPGSPFREFNHFHLAMQKRGVGAMEILAMDMKLRGMYIARQLSFKGVSFKIVEVPLEDDFIKIYDLSTDLWVRALKYFREAAELIQADRSMVTVMWSQFWSAHQRFFKYLCIAAKVPKAVSLAREAVKCGKCVVIGLQSTGEARTLDQLDKDDGELSNFVSTAKGVFRTMVEKHFPAPDRKKLSGIFDMYGPAASDLFSNKRKVDEDSNSSSTKKFRIMDFTDDSSESSDNFSDDEIVLKTSEKPKKETTKEKNEKNTFRNVSCSSDAKQNGWKLKEELLERIELLGDKLPPNAIDEIIDELGGADNVAELTGRKGRVIHNDEGFIYESRSGETSKEMINMMEKQKFMEGEKDVAIISEAASSGISLHSDRRALNRRCRVHITLELPWSADRAIQQFGRTHRSNQVNAPEYIFLISNLAGERRFASVVAKRLESLGALTHGDRRATESRDLSRFNIDNNYGRAAMEVSLRTVLGLERPLVSPPKSYKGTNFFKDVKEALIGVGLIVGSELDPNNLVLDGERRSIGRFLNRILGMPVHLQNSLFDYFTDTMEAIIDQAKKAGRYDLGILDLAGNGGNIERVSVSKYIRKHVGKTAVTELHKFSVERGMSWIEAILVWERRKDNADGFYISNQVKNNHREVMLVMALDDDHDDAKKQQQLYTVYKPNIGEQVKKESMTTIKKKYKKVTKEEAEDHWIDHYTSSMNICSHAYWTGTCRSTLLGQNCDVGLRQRAYNVLSGSVLCVWSRVEMVLAERCGVNAKLQMVRLKTQDGHKLVGSLIPDCCVTPLHEALAVDAESVQIEHFKDRK